jgi:hypothetical protein
MHDPRVAAYALEASRHLARAGHALATRQTRSGPTKGNVPPFEGSGEPDFHGALAAIWVWARYQHLAGDPRFAAPRDAAWSFVEGTWEQFIPESLGPDASDEAAFDCAMVLRAALAERGLAAGDSQRKKMVASAARLLGAYLSELSHVGGRAFSDPGFIAWCLLDHARAVDDKSLLVTGQRFVERFFGMRVPPPFTSEPEDTRGLFDFSSTTATRVLAVMSSEGNTPFLGVWLRERVKKAIPEGYVGRSLDANVWNASVAAALGRAYIVSTDTAFRDGCVSILAELAGRDLEQTGALGRDDENASPDTLATFYWGLAVDSLVRDVPAAAPMVARNAQGRR